MARTEQVTRKLYIELGSAFARLALEGMKGLRGLVGGIRSLRPRAGAKGGAKLSSSSAEGRKLVRRGGVWAVSGSAGPPGVTSIALAGGGLRVAAMQKGEVSFWQHVNLPAGMLRQGVVVDPEGLAGCLRDTLDRGTLPRKLAWALPGTVATARLLRVPTGKTHEMNSIVSREAAAAMVVDAEEHYLHWQIIGLNQVFVLAVQRVAVDNLVLASHLAKAEVRAIDLRPLALALVIGAREAVIADIEANGLEILIVAQGVPVAMRSLILSDDSLDAVYARSKLEDELAIALQLFNKTNSETPLASSAPIYLTGDLSDDDLAGKIAFLTKHPTVRPDAPFACPPGFPAPKFLTNLGLLLKRG